MSKPFTWRVLPAALAVTILPCAPTAAQPGPGAERLIEEVIVTARQREEGLQDVPVTIAAFTDEDLQRYNITTLTEASKMVPNMEIYHGGSGNGSNLRLRGIGSSSISAAFDQSVAINVDGVVVNIGRFIHNAYMDMQQLEILKGPQSLYFGKSATAGVVSVMSKDPGDEFELEFSGGYEVEYEQTYLEGIISGPITDTLGARFAIGYTDSEELFENLTPGVANEWRGEEAINARFTLLWEPTDTLTARLKYAYSEYQNDGANGRTEEECPEGTVQPSAIPSASFAIQLFPGVDDCKLNGNTSIADLEPRLRAGLPDGADDGVPYLDQETDFLALQLDWDMTEALSLTSITGYVDLEHWELDIYDFNAGVFGGQHRNTYEALSQELRLASNFEGPLNFMLGGYYQDVEQEFNAYQYAFNLGIIAGPDPFTGNEYDYNKNHFLDTEVWSGFVAGYWDITDKWELTAGIRYTDEDKDGKITLPYIHAAASAFGFGCQDPPPAGTCSEPLPEVIDGLEFEDENWSPEVALTWQATDDLSFFAAYKEGFKSGGIDNSALPTASLSRPVDELSDFLSYDSETAQGGELGMKSNLLDGTMRLNATAFHYIYDDLQVQLFNAAIIQFETFNASELTTTGFEFDLVWAAPIDGLTVRSAWAITDTEYTDDFINATGENLDNEDGTGSADFAGYVGFTYDRALTQQWRFNVSTDVRYNDGYPYSATLNPYEQDSYWWTDAAINLYSEDGRWEFSLIGRNLGDETVALGTGARPGACYQADPGNPNPALRCAGLGPSPDPNAAGSANVQDQSTTTTLGRQYTLRARVRF